MDSDDIARKTKEILDHASPAKPKKKPRPSKKKPHPHRQADMIVIGDGNIMIGGVHHYYGDDSTDEDSD